MEDRFSQLCADAGRDVRKGKESACLRDVLSLSYVMGSCVLPANAEECKENISFIFQDRVFESFEEFQTAIIIDNKNILQLEKPLEILRAGIIDNEPMLKTPWGDKRLADKAVNK